MTITALVSRCERCCIQSYTLAIPPLFLALTLSLTKCPNFRTQSNFNKISFVFIDHHVSIELDSTLRRTSCRRVRNRWHLLLTLHNNPSLQEHRRPDIFIQKSPFAAFQVMIQKGIVQYNHCEGENENDGVEDAKL